MKYRLFKRKKSNQFFFQIQTDGGDAVLESQGYDQKDARNNGLRSVVTNGGDAGKYEKKTEGGKHYFILKAGNGQEIARSVKFDNGGDADKSMALCVKEVPKLAPDGDGAKAGTAQAGGTSGGTTTTTTATTTATTTTAGEAGKTVTEGSNLVAANRTANVNIDSPPPPKEKKPKKKRKKKPAGEKKPKKEKVYLSNGEYYFNDITYQVFRSGNDKHYFTFKNKAEKTIFLNADVRGFVTQDEAEAMVKEVFQYAPFEGNYEGKATTNGKYYFYLKNKEGKNLAKSFFYGTTEGMQNAIGELLGNEAAIAAARASAGGAAATAATPAAKAGVDEYLACSAYSGAAGWHTFTEGGEFYFSYNNEDGKSLLRSEGYTTEKARDNGIESVKKNAPLNERWKVLSEDGKWFHSLKAGNHQEIARSCPLDSEPKAMNWSSYSAKKVVVAKTVAPAAAAATAVAAKKANVDEYLECSAYAGGSGFHKFEKNGEFYFGYNDDKGNTILRSEGYTSESGRDNGIESVKKNATDEKRWSTVEEGGKYFRILKAGNHQEIGRSCPADSANGPAWSWMWSSFSVASALPKKSIPAPEKIVFTPEPVANVDEYLECSAYAGGSGFHKFEKNGEFYFGYNDDKGNTILRSEGYTSESGRDNGIESVKKNATDEKRWSTVEEGGKYFRILKAGNHQEIGRSCPADSANGPAWSWMWSSFSVASAVPKQAIPAPEKIVFTPEPVANVDEYLECSAYAGGSGFHKFEKNGEFYFGYNDDKGNTILRSEGYTSESGRDNGIESVKKNATDETRWSTIEEDGKYFRILKAGNHQEIGRSCPADSASGPAWSWMWSSFAVAGAVAPKSIPAAEKIKFAAPPPPPPPAPEPVVVKVKSEEEKEDDYLPCKEYQGHNVTDKVNHIAFFKHKNGQHYFVVYNAKGDVNLRSEGFQDTKTRDEELAGVLKNMKNNDMYKTVKKGKYSMRILYDKTGREVGRSCLIKAEEKKVVKAAPIVAAAAVVAAAAPVVVKKKTTEEKEDDYLACKEYEGKTITDKANNIALFKHTNGQFYFVAYRKDGGVRYRSEGFSTTEKRKEELDGVIAYMGNKDMMKTIKKGKYTMHILYDAEGREVGRSCLIKEQEKKVIKAAPVVAAAAAAVVATQPKVKKEVDKEDDYLACKEYEGKKINDKTNNIALFKHKNGQFYFAVYNDDKTVRLRSEGFKSGKDRDVELAGVIKHLGDKSMYKTIKKGKYHMDILYDKTGREVGRSCLETERKVAPVVIPPTKKKVVPVAAATKVAAATTAAAATTTTAAAAKSGCAWWPWLLLLLIPLLLCFFKPEWCGCGDKAAVTNTPPPVEEVTPPVEEVTPPPPAEVTCNCSGNSSNRIFNVPTGGSPKSLSKLGTNPEFGNSHSLDAAGFYNKLKRAHANSSRDKVFLDNLFKGMGYAGFGDATAAMFSEVRIPRGTSGNMGRARSHQTIYATLDVTADRDTEAFRIDAKNGCDMNFMKTCGNHFFYCPN